MAVKRYSGTGLPKPLSSFPPSFPHCFVMQCPNNVAFLSLHQYICLSSQFPVFPSTSTTLFPFPFAHAQCTLVWSLQFQHVSEASLTQYASVFVFLLNAQYVLNPFRLHGWCRSLVIGSYQYSLFCSPQVVQHTVLIKEGME